MKLCVLKLIKLNISEVTTKSISDAKNGLKILIINLMKRKKNCSTYFKRN